MSYWFSVGMTETGVLRPFTLDISRLWSPLAFRPCMNYLLDNIILRWFVICCRRYNSLSFLKDKTKDKSFVVKFHSFLLEASKSGVMSFDPTIGIIGVGVKNFFNQ